jgi:hypothetical protein
MNDFAKNKLGSSQVSVTSNKLTISAGALIYNSALWYQFNIVTTYTGLNYSQILTAVITNSAPQVPLVTLA